MKTHLKRNCPYVGLTSTWEGRPADALGQCDLNGYCLHFVGPAFNLMPDGVAAYLISHELCHGWFRARGMDTHYARAVGDKLGSDSVREQIVNFEEGAVESLLGRWGFIAEPFNEWCADEGIWSRLRAAGVERCGQCGERNVPEPPAVAKLLVGGSWQRVCDECAAQLAAEVAAGQRAASTFTAAAAAQ